MLDPLTINPLTLPSVPLEFCQQLPETPCIYFAIDSQGIVQYIGRSINPRLRWTQHHRYKRLAKMNGVKIAYLTVDAELMADVEQALIVWFNPPLNNLGAQCKPDDSANKTTLVNKTTKEKGSVASSLMRIRKIEEVDVPGLAAMLKAAREADKRSLAEICRQVSVSPQYWYNLERGAVSTMSYETLRRIEEALGVDFGVKL